MVRPKRIGPIVDAVERGQYPIGDLPRRPAVAGPRPIQAWLRRGALLVFTLPLLVVCGDYGFLWTDTLEIGERGLIKSTFGELCWALVHGIPGHYYRPTVVLVHSADYWLFGNSALAFRLTNLGCHMCVAVLTYELLKATVCDVRAAFATSALFAVHPLAVTAIAWASDRTDIIALLSSVVFFLCVNRYVKAQRIVTLVGAMVALLVGLGAKETCAATLLVTGAVLLGGDVRHRRPMARVFGLQVLTVGAWFLWRGAVATNPVERMDDGLSFAEHAALAAWVHLRYARDLLLCARLTVCDAATVPSAPVRWIVGGCTAVLLAWALAWSARRRNHRGILVALLWSIAFLVPTSGLVALKHVRADRYLYAALPGILLGCVLSVRAWISRLDPQNRFRVATWTFMSVYAYLSVCMSMRAEHFRSDEALWKFETTENDSCMEGHANLARIAYLRGQADVAIAEADKVLAPRSRALVAYADAGGAALYLGLALVDLGQVSRAALMLEDIVARTSASPVRSEAAYALALLDLNVGRFTAMISHLDQASSGALASSSSDIMLLRSYAEWRLGQWSASENHLQVYSNQREENASPGRTRMAAELRFALSRRSSSVP